jgi:predicted phage tail protein
MRPIRGAGGGGKSGDGGHAPTESSDSLHSIQYARVIDAICEGEIEGLVNGLQSVYLNETPVQNADGTLNFSGVTLITRNGTQSQAYIPGFTAAAAETGVSVQVKQATPVVRSISDANANAVRVTISVPQLTFQNAENGDLGGTAVSLAIDVQSNGGGFVPQALSYAYTSSGLSVGDTSVVSSIDCADYQLDTVWTPQSGLRQSCTVQLEYRVVGAATWGVWQTHKFITFAGAALSPTLLKKTFVVTGIQIAKYEFRIVKTDGSYTPPDSETLTGLGYGGAVKFAGAGAYKPVLYDTISGKTTSRYQRAYRIPLSGEGPWDIRVRRITADSAQSNLQNAIYWDSYTELIDAKLTYPNTALVALAVDAQRFQSIPSRGYEIKGLKIRIPSNYDPIERTYSGTWDGTFTVAWSNNPAWCFYDLLTAERYGLGRFIDPAQVDKWSLYEIARYCDELVDDGYGGLEPRFTCNLYLQTREEAYNVIQTMASIFCGLPYWAGGSIVATQDSPKDPTVLYTNANVVPDENGIYFNYAGSSLKARHTVALVSWNDPSDLYKQKIEYVADDEGIARYGVVETEVVAFGCTSRGQAHRYGRRILFAERMETETVSFKTGLDGLLVGPGDVIQTSDPVRAGDRLGGRLLAASINTVTLDSEVTIEDGKTYTLWVTLPDGTVQSRDVITPSGAVSDLSVTPDFGDTPQAMSIWVLAAVDLVPETWRVISVTEADGTQAQITALAYRADKYEAIENGLILEPLQTSALSGTADTPTDFVVTESLYLVTSVVVGTRLTASWLGIAVYFELQYRKQDGNWTTLTTHSTSVDIAPVDAGIYEFSLVAINAAGRRSIPRTLTQEVLGKTAAPADVTGFSVIKSSGVAVASWAQHPDLDVRVGGRIVVRHTPKTSDVSWNDGYIMEEFGGDTVTGVMALVTGTYMAKAKDSSGNWSQNAVMFQATEGMVTGFTTVAEIVQAPLFTGQHTNVAVVDGALQLDGSVLVDDMTDLVDSWSLLDNMGGVAAAGSYEFDNFLDLGTLATRRFEADITSLSFDTGDLIDSRLDPIDQWDSFDGDVVNDCDVTLFAATTNDNPNGSPTWSDWTPFMVGDFTCRTAKFRLDFESGQSTHNILVSQLTVHVKVPA